MCSHQVAHPAATIASHGVALVPGTGGTLMELKVHHRPTTPGARRIGMPNKNISSSGRPGFEGCGFEVMFETAPGGWQPATHEQEGGNSPLTGLV